MTEREKTSMDRIIEDRTNYFIEMLVVIIIIILFLIPSYLLPFMLDETSAIYAPLYFSLKALGIFFGIPITLFIIHKYLPFNTSDSRSASQLNPSFGFLKLFKVSRDNAKYQLLYGLLLLFLVFIPLDFFTSLLIPEVLEYQADVLTSVSLGYYFLESFPTFLLSVVIIQTSVAVVEETISRGLLAKRGAEHVQVMSAVMISSFYFGLGHLAYFLSPVSANYPIWYPMLWFIETFSIGIVLALFIIRKKWILPIIFAHAANNIISAFSIWSHMRGYDFLCLTLYLYIPLLTIALILLTFQFNRVKESVSTGLNIIANYFSNGNNKGEISKSNKFMTLILDLAVACIIFFVVMFII